MRVNNNQTINPTQALDSVQAIYPARSNKIKKVTVTKSEQGGASDHSGNVFIPGSDSAYDRTVRYHEALHVDFTPKKFKCKDALDQALEDARLHRHCSKSSEIKSVRRDEIATAVRDLRKTISKSRFQRPNAITSVVVLRAVSILGNEPKYSKLVRTGCNLIGPGYLDKVNKAIKMIDTTPGSAKWNKARTMLHEYFSKEFTPQPDSGKHQQEQPQDKQDSSELPDVPQADTDEERSDLGSDDSDSDEAGESGPESDEESEDESKDGSGESDDTDEDEESDADGSDDNEPEMTDKKSASDAKEYDSDSFDSDSSSDMDAESESAENGAAGEDFSDVVDIQVTPKPKKIQLHPDAYRGSSISKFDHDLDHATRLQQLFPKDLIIHRLDTGNDSVPTLQGNRGRVNTLSGSRINPGRLALAMRNNVRVFNQRRGEGGGAILIDNSGSMSIPESTLIQFAASLPLATIAFYSAAGDVDRIKEGHLSVYAANGLRAGRFGVSVYGGYGNLVDYQAISWLTDQPGPRWYVGDLQFTGGWSFHCTKFFQTLVNRKLVTHVHNLSEMTQILKRRQK